MSATAELLRELEGAGVKVEAEGTVLKWRAPAGVMTPELKKRLIEKKPEVLTYLQTPPHRGAGHPSPENARRPIDDRQREALELLGELTHYFNMMLEALELSGTPTAEAGKQAMAKTKATKQFRQWLALG